ncbi:MAG: hypothetical protein U9N12_08550 [Euryarchaeota archaeon]|nr:hypothetical protein [Euryarchaeota archaeon]
MAPYPASCSKTPNNRQLDRRKADERHEQRKKIGVHLCRCGGNIGDVVDVKRITDKVSGMKGVAPTNIQDYLCSSAGQGQIESDIKKGLIDRVVISSCPPEASSRDVSCNGTESRRKPDAS